MSEQSKIPRRPVLTGLAALVGAGIIGGGAYEGISLWRAARSPRVYSDLLAGLGNREMVNQVGEAVLGEVGTMNVQQTIRELRQHIAHRPLPAVITDDAVQGRLLEAQGWVMPETLAVLCGLSAKLG